IRRTRDEFGGPNAHLLRLIVPPLHLRNQVVTLSPPQLVKPTREGSKPTPRPCRLGSAHQYADAAHTVALLRARRKRPRSRPTKKRDELAPHHGKPPLPTRGAS